MSASIIRRRQRITKTLYELSFASKVVRGSGYGFPCDYAGRLLDEGDHRWDEKIEELRQSPEYTNEGVVERKETYIEYAIARCTCGAEVVLSDPLDNKCEECNRWYNMCGQEVVDPHSELGIELRREDDRYADDEDKMY